MCYIVAIIRDRIQELPDGNLAFRPSPMTAALHFSKLNAPAGDDLVCRPLVAMAARGFDRECLLYMQDAALRYAAQSLQNNTSKQVSPAALLTLVDLQLGGSGRVTTEISPGHLAAYMSTKAFLSQFRQRDAMFDVDALSAGATLVPGDSALTDWLAHTLTGLKRDAARLAAKTPMFASEIATQVHRVTQDPELEGLAQAMHAAAALPPPTSDEDQVLDCEFPAPTSS